MLQNESFIFISDNTIVNRVKCISGRGPFKMGSIIKVSVRKTIPAPLVKRKRLQAFKKGQLCSVLILTTKSPFNRNKASFWLWSKYNTGCILAPDKAPIASRIRGVVFREASFVSRKSRKIMALGEVLL